MTTPSSTPTVSPYLIVDGARACIGFMERVLGGTTVRTFDREDGGLVHAEVRIGDGVVMIGDAAEGWPAVAAHVHVYVPDVDASYRAALEAGAASVQPPRRQEGDEDRRAGVRDASGTTWWMATREG